MTKSLNCATVRVAALFVLALGTMAAGAQTYPERPDLRRNRAGIA